MEEQQEKFEKNKGEIKKYFTVSLAVFLTFCACTTVIFLIFQYDKVAAGMENLMTILQPIIIGFVLAYLLNPVMKFLEKHILKLVDGRFKSPRKEQKFARNIGTLGAALFLILIIALLLEMIVPQLIKSISGMVTSLPTEVNSFINWINQYIKSENEVAEQLENMLRNSMQYLQNWAQTSLLPDIQTYIGSLTSGVLSVFKAMLNVIVGLIVSVYVLLSKEKFIGQAKKIMYAVFKPNHANALIETARKSNEIFSGFITGKLLDSAIVGMLCYIVLIIMKMPYALLVSVIVGVTNVIPFFGPLIGAVPSFLIILLAEPVKGLYFLIVILVLQQIDGNIIGPKILGNSTGLTSFWVVFAILVGGGLFGCAGMLLGVPAFAVIYYLIKNAVNHGLAKRKLSVETDDYIELQRIDKDSNEMIYPGKEVLQEAEPETPDTEAADNADDIDKNPRS
ncbi:MAG: AI-2E family transporter [Lachnospiraceae bacterium]|nr:AI-2E family transporter [Lachnospiraceae bacterium]